MCAYETWTRPRKYIKLPWTQRIVREGYPDVWAHFNDTVTGNLAENVYSYRGSIPEKDKYGYLPVHDFSLIKGKSKYSGSFGFTLLNASSGAEYVYNGIGFPTYYNYRLDPLYGNTTALSLSRAKDLRKQAIVEAYANLNAPDLDALVIMAEFDEAVREGLKNVPKLKRQLRKALNGKRKGSNRKPPSQKKKKSAEPVDKTAGGWLSWRYGILPMILTYEDIAEFLENTEKLRRSGSGKCDEYSESSEYHHVNFSGYRFTFRKKVRTEAVGACRIICVPKKVDGYLGFTPYDAVRALWERTPYSFAIDWFAGIGNYLDSMRPGGMTVISQSNTAIHKVTTTVEFISVENVSSSLTIHSLHHGWRAVSKRVYIERINTITKPLVPIGNPQGMSADQNWDALALAWLKSR